MNIKLKLLKDLLLNIVEMIDAGTCNPSEEELDKCIKLATNFNKGIKRISKRYACENILHCSLTTFDNYVKLGLIPAGHKEVGFKELSWSEEDFNESVRYRIKAYKANHSLL